jgi:phosphoribosylaminoimidazole (AIR) synthetase
MGWGFAIIVNKTEMEKALSVLEKAGAQPEQIGIVTSNQKIVVHHANKELILA